MFQTNMKVRFKEKNVSLFHNAGSDFGGEISVSAQNVFYGEDAVDTVQVDNALYWEHQGDQGCLWLYHNGLCAHGYVIRNGIKTEVDVQSDDAVFPFAYVNGNGDMVTARLHAGTRSNPETGGYLEYGALYFNDEKVFESYKCDKEGNIEKDQSDNGFLRSTFDGHLRFIISLSSLWDALGSETVHSFISPDFNIYSGTIEISSDYSRVSGGVISEQRTQITGGIQVTAKGSDYNLLTGNQSCHYKTKTEGQLNSSRVNELKAAYRELGNAPMSITELFTLPAPDMYAANQKATELLYYLAVAYVADDTYSCGGQDIKWTNWFGITKETAESRIKDVDYRILDLIGTNADKRVKDFLHKYAKANLANSYVSSDDPALKDALFPAKIRLLGSKNYCTLPSMVSYYLQGDGDDCLAKDPGYCIAMEVINKYVYAGLTPKFINYLTDNPAEWAEKLYKHCCSNLQMLKLTALSGSKGSTEISHKTMMLNLLDSTRHSGIVNRPDGTSSDITYGAAVYARVFNLQLSEMADLLGEGYLDPKSANYIEMMKHIYGVIFQELQKSQSDYFTREILAAFQKDMKDFADLSQELFIQTCLEMTEAGLNMLSHGAALASVIPKLKNLSSRPWAATCGTVVSIIMYASSIASLSTVFMNWEKATGLEKAEAILVCVQSVANIAVSGMKFASIRTLISENATQVEKINAALRLKFDGSDMSNISGLAKAGGFETIEDFGLEAGGRYGKQIGQEGMSVSRFTKFFRVAEIVVRGLNMLLMGFIIVVSSLEIDKEIKSGGWNISVIMEVMSIACLAAALVIDVVVLVGEVFCSAAFTVLPVVGAAIALLGLVFQIVAMFTRKPKNPVVEFIKDVIVVFLITLDIPSEEWVMKQKKNALSLDVFLPGLEVEETGMPGQSNGYFVISLSEA